VPLCNRVTPLGDLVAVRDRGLVYGNRGCLHDAEGRIVRRAATRRWIACRLEYRGWHRSAVPQPGRYTALFFLDDATALAAGHRPCALCRRADYDRVLDVLDLPGAEALDIVLDAERRAARPAVDASTLPDGAFVLDHGEPYLVFDGRLRAWTTGGYGPHQAPGDDVELVTPPSLLRVLRAGWNPLVPFLHPSALPY
jgi:hypothetical protein